MTLAEVEVFSEARSGGVEQVIARLGPQKVFGERALLAEEKRNASVRCVTAVDVLVMSRDDFPADPNVRHYDEIFPADVFDGPEFASGTVGPYLVAARIS